MNRPNKKMMYNRTNPNPNFPFPSTENKNRILLVLFPFLSRRLIPSPTDEVSSVQRLEAPSGGSGRWWHTRFWFAVAAARGDEGLFLARFEGLVWDPKFQIRPAVEIKEKATLTALPLGSCSGGNCGSRPLVSRGLELVADEEKDTKIHSVIEELNKESLPAECNSGTDTRNGKFLWICEEEEDMP
ncbi:hypothetical protein OROMI_026723 [Orobanche minor]